MEPSKDQIRFRIPRAEFLAFGKAIRVGGIMLGDVMLEFTRDSLTIDVKKVGQPCAVRANSADGF